ncbi:Tn7-like element transposition protein TnsE [Desulfosporosinus sp. Sb-LF]|uniref:Tn7-like element transposition protein TnsE n=1 Tax=Desulfosporosinus sp. Sb-LF TaxID=2560027 RepID=UPI00107F9B4C|nr:Tn7-like element transposition protein TnsE [Desulfosporosinus sp. Sb-LF]TGE32992.1 hypothetical protein E4K68_09105 [Desulfosporosinus sp. Sb-LF]
MFIKGWPFSPGESVQLLWIKSPFKEQNQEWKVPLVLEGENGTIKLLNISWGLLPYFRIGQFYIKGLPSEFHRSGTLVSLSLSNPSEGQLLRVQDLPSGLIELKNSEASEEYVWVCQCKELHVIIPCVEIIRSFLTPNATLARALLEPNGIDFVATYVKSIEGLLKINFDPHVPRKIIMDSSVNHVAWLITDPLAKKVWNSVYNGVYPRGDINLPLALFTLTDEDLIGSKKITAVPPMDRSCIWQVRAIQQGQAIIVLEIVSVQGLELPYKKIEYAHKSFTDRKNVEIIGHRSAVKRKKRSSINKDKSIVIDNPTSNSKTVTRMVSNNVLSFTELPELVRQNREVNAYREKNNHENHRQFSKRERREIEDKAGMEAREKERLAHLEKESGKIPEVMFSGEEVFYTGNSEVRPLDFRGPNVVIGFNDNGLEQFRGMLEVIARFSPVISVSPPKIDVLPSGRQFSRNEDGGPRKYALVTIEHRNKPKYILEVERPEKVQLSTLIIELRDKRKLSEVELFSEVQGLLHGLINNYGSWRKSQILNHPVLRIVKVKHLSKWSIIDWAAVIWENLNFIEEEDFLEI